MPKIRFINLPRPLWEHILERVAERAITLDDLQRLRSWVVTEPQAPEGDWYKDFGSFVLCGTGEYPKTVLKKGMKPFGTPLEKMRLHMEERRKSSATCCHDRGRKRRTFVETIENRHDASWTTMPLG